MPLASPSSLQARCDGTLFWREYGAAWDFESLGPTDLVYTAHHNLSLPADNGPENYRLPGLLNMATRAWTQTYWGEWGAGWGADRAEQGRAGQGRVGRSIQNRRITPGTGVGRRLEMRRR